MCSGLVLIGHGRGLFLQVSSVLAMVAASCRDAVGSCVWASFRAGSVFGIRGLRLGCPF